MVKKQNQFLIIVITFIFSLALIQNFAFAGNNIPENQAIGNKIVAENVNAICDFETTMELDKMETGEDGIARQGKMTIRGTGYFVEGDDNIVYTNAHMVRVENDMMVQMDIFSILTGIPPEKIKITKYINKIILNGRVYRGEVISFSHDIDAAIVKCVGIKREDHGVVKIGNSDKVIPGDLVWAIGNSYGEYSQSLSDGVVSKTHMIVGFGYIEDFIQTIAPLYPGNSGSPIFNYKGEVIAMLKGGPSDDLNWVIPINLFETLKNAKGQKEVPCIGVEGMLKNFPRSSTPFGDSVVVSKEDLEILKGITGIKDTDNLIALAKASYNRGAIVEKEYSNATGFDILQLISSSLEPGVIKRGDLILSINGKIVKNGADMRMILLYSGKKAGEIVQVEYERAEKGKMVKKTASIILTDHPQSN